MSAKPPRGQRQPPDPTRAPADLPQPGEEARALSARLSRRIAAEIAEHGPIGFDRFMEHALYAPGLGYYSAGAIKLGAAGDFVTAPELGGLFGRCLARQCAEVLEALDGGDILELGPGSGALTATVLAELDALGRLPARYRLLETSADLRARQREHLSATVPQALQRVEWLDTAPAEAFDGVVLANEVVDALPFRCFSVAAEGSLLELRVGGDADGFRWEPTAADPQFAAAVERRCAARLSELPQGYVGELRTLLAPWLRTVTAGLRRGVALLVDYGYPRAERYHPQRTSGTLLCHYRHRAHDDPFVLVGLQDITAFVDFTALAQAGRETGLTLAGYTSQAGFLLGCGLDEVLAGLETLPTERRLELVNEAKRLTLPEQMGEGFKAIALARDLPLALRGFQVADRRARL